MAQGAGLFIENRDRLTPCDLAVKSTHHDVATFLESRMVFVSGSSLFLLLERQERLSCTCIWLGTAMGGNAKTCP